jgi:hypothetical protein
LTLEHVWLKIILKKYMCQRVMGYPECEVVKLTRVSLHFLTKFFLFNCGIFYWVLLLEVCFFFLIFLWVLFFNFIVLHEIIFLCALSFFRFSFYLVITMASWWSLLELARFFFKFFLLYFVFLLDASFNFLCIPISYQ